MIIPMTKYSFVLLSADKERFLEALQELGLVDIKRSSKPVDDVSRSILSEIENTRELINRIKNGRDPALESLSARRGELVKALSAASHWGDYDKALVEKLGIRFYCIPSKTYDPSWEESYAVEKIDSDGRNVWFVVAGDNEGFPIAEIPAPERTAKEIEEEISRIDEETASIRQSLEEKKKDIPELEKKMHTLGAELNVYLAGVGAGSAAENSLAIFEGYAPKENEEELSKAFDGMDVYYIAEEAKVEDNPPIKLKNNRFVKQFEPLTGMYGMPVYNEFDPTVFLSIFFLLFFAMCMGDAGYGLLLIGIGLFLRKKSGGLAKMWGLITILGVGTVVVGLVMGGFFGIDLSSQEWVPAWMREHMLTGDIEVGGSTYSKQMIISLLLGIVHICLALIVKAVWAIRKDGFKNSLSTLGWTLLIVGGVIGLAVGLTGVISESAMKWLLIGIAAVSALGIFIFNKWGRNPLLNVGVGLWDTYSMASGILGDVLSYIRLYALGLSGGMLGSTFNLIGEMVKGTDPTWQWIPFVLILLVGHILNLAMSCLGAFVHPLRLNFVEFFKNSGYEGQGSTYNPISK